MAGEYSTVAANLGGHFLGLRTMLSEMIDGGGMSGDDDGVGGSYIGRWPSETGFTKAQLVELETFITDQFLPALRAGVADTLYAPEFDHGAAIYA